MTGKGREDNKGNSARKRKPGDSPLSRVICVGLAISMNTSLHVASALIHSLPMSYVRLFLRKLIVLFSHKI